MNYAIVLILLNAGLIQLSYAQQNFCTTVIAPDGSIYDLSHISNKVHQYTQVLHGTTFTFNISICAPLPEPCGYACLNHPAGVCLTWGPTLGQSKCMGQFDPYQIIGLNNGLGVQIVYNNGDTCGSCIPSAPRSSIITLICSNSGAKNKIYWNNVIVDQPGSPSVEYFYGTFNCTSPFETAKEIVVLN